MLKGLGIDLVEISRVSKAQERFGLRFMRRILRPDELAEYRERFAPGLTDPEERSKLSPQAAAFLAARFAAKEAAVKSLGTGFAQGVGFKDIRVRRAESGRPELVFYGPARERLAALGAGGGLLSLTHSRDSAAAVVILE